MPRVIEDRNNRFPRGRICIGGYGDEWDEAKVAGHKRGHSGVFNLPQISSFEYTDLLAMGCTDLGSPMLESL